MWESWRSSVGKDTTFGGGGKKPLSAQVRMDSQPYLFYSSLFQKVPLPFKPKTLQPSSIPSFHASPPFDTPTSLANYTSKIIPNPDTSPQHFPGAKQTAIISHLDYSSSLLNQSFCLLICPYNSLSTSQNKNGKKLCISYAGEMNRTPTFMVQFPGCS